MTRPCASPRLVPRAEPGSRRPPAGGRRCASAAPRSPSRFDDPLADWASRWRPHPHHLGLRSAAASTSSGRRVERTTPLFNPARGELEHPQELPARARAARRSGRADRVWLRPASGRRSPADGARLAARLPADGRRHGARPRARRWTAGLDAAQARRACCRAGAPSPTSTGSSATARCHIFIDGELSHGVAACRSP
jgi:hypothetical protein